MSYQNIAEADIAGYNDCPIVESSARKDRQRRRPHPTGSGSISGSTSTSTLTSSTLLNSMASPYPPQGPPQGPTMGRTSSTASVMSIPLLDSKGISTETTLAKLDVLFALNNSLPHRELLHYQQKLRDAVAKGIKEHWNALICLCIDDYKNKDTVKNKLIKFMLQNDGTTAWCTPLRKILENTTI